MAMAGEPFHVEMPKIWGVKLIGELRDWVSAKDQRFTPSLTLRVRPEKT